MPQHITAPFRFDANPDGFSHPDFGGTLAVLQNTVAYTDTAAKTLFALPLGAVLVSWIINVTTAFNSSSTDVLDLGVSGTAQQYAASVDVSSTGLKTSGVVLTQLGQTPLTAAVDVLGVYTPGAADQTAGLVIVTVLYYLMPYA